MSIGISGPPEEAFHTRLLAGVTVAGTAVALLYAHGNHGLLSVDSTAYYDQVHSLAFGPELHGWDLRSFFLPLLLAPGLLLAGVVGITTTGGQLAVMQTCLVLACNTLLALGLRQLSRVVLADVRPAGVAAIALLLNPSWIRTLVDQVADAPLAVAWLWSLALLLDVSGRGRRRAIAAGVVAGAAVLLKYSALLLVAAYVPLALAGGAPARFSRAVRFALGFLAVLLAGGLLDAITWGAPFHSFFGFYRYNLGEQLFRAYRSTAPWYGYLALALQTPWLPALAGSTFWAWALAARPQRISWLLLGGGAGLYLALLSPSENQQLRFLWPALPPLALGLGALLIGPRALPNRTLRQVMATGLALAGLVGVVQITTEAALGRALPRVLDFVEQGVKPRLRPDAAPRFATLDPVVLPGFALQHQLTRYLRYDHNRLELLRQRWRAHDVIVLYEGPLTREIVAQARASPRHTVLQDGPFHAVCRRDLLVPR